ncbi:1-(5-phosphoribosyl)-5-[(5-phosphoribosylamino)methylideneamino] imidazole-4-carboxamide isomerase [Dokdonella immobilis]|uniref:1-(5-phosphoribosyl)-5-[(5-phosphoribosylamino)methylideneamino] imidazole-4-carboxamide isomerase n=1 Tax=Dokdonella immobilis TaxID=578942 RepID=A0A1I4XCT1_9GAMM|nr:1-(5-phosphoribosyl)-5-[(5-phosphoribosylamino)methylideneamino] imidazole-4-carboxamide isomerase [Dokdonella immobilis]SFN23585.1 1-(5-phosphoribosyl)-5-[(5-phosphoribosylamino)methylideneamino] imidazole-4-carboxamide isomerase [Dokdonella immobilis]
MNIEIIPALDLRGGRVVRLRQGDYARETGYAIDALEQGRRYRDIGARWLHVVDLDGARDGGFENFKVLEGLVRLGLEVQAGGGVRDEAGLRRLLDIGVRRVVVGSIAVRQPALVSEWIARHGADRIVVALDTRRSDAGWSLPVAGWTETAGVLLDELAPRYAGAGARHLLCTDIARDGMLSGPNLELYRHLAQVAPSMQVQASGGVRDLDDLRSLQGIAAAVILGRSLLEGRLDLGDALAC